MINFAVEKNNYNLIFKYFMKQILLRGGLPLLAMVSLTACFDDNYDLSDIDTTSEFKVKDLVLPINIDPVTLGDIIEIKEDEQIKEIFLNGETVYAVQESGEFKSDDISIPGFSTEKINVKPTVINFTIPTVSADISLSDINPIDLKFKDFISQSELNKSFTFSATNIDDAIVQITDLYTKDFYIKLDFEVNDALASCADTEIKDLLIDLPKGMVVDEIIPVQADGKGYDPTTGRLNVSSIRINDGKAELSLKASMINLPANNCGIDYSKHSLNLATVVNISDEAVLTIIPKSGELSKLPTKADLNISYTITALDVEAVSGTINYKLDGINISPVSLSNLPDFLAGDETNLILANPQIYLSVNNPVAGDKLGYSTGLNITAVRKSGKTEFPLNNTVMVGFDKNVDGPYQFCLSPSTPASMQTGFENATHIQYSDLSNVISGKGMPEKLEINLVDPQIYTQDVEKFQLGRDLHKLEGKWEFLAPLAMAPGTDAKIVYTDVVDGWSSEDLDKVLIQKLEVNLNLTNNTPLTAELTGYPIDKNGKQINGVNVEGAVIKGNAVNEPVTLYITGEVKDLDGIRFTATIRPENDKTLSPNQSITLTNIKAKVSGNYTTDF